MGEQKIRKQDLKKIDDSLYEIPKEVRPFMRVPARLYADEKLLDAALGDLSVEQLVNTASLPGIVNHALAMPDIHQGYGFPIGGVVATALPHGVISPGGVGYDINCGVRFLASSLEREQFMPFRDTMVDAFLRNVPTGLGRGGDVRINREEMDKVLTGGARWAVKHGFGSAEDVAVTEENGGFTTSDASAVSPKAKERGNDQLGTLGSGNHFLEIQEVAEIYDEEAARAMGLFVGQVTVMIHSGSRGLGHQVCTDYVQRLQKSLHTHGIEVPDRELVCAPFDSPEGQDYWGAMQAAANYAWCNRQLLAHRVRQTFAEVLKGKVKDASLRQIYDVAHNIAKVEEHEVGGHRMKVCVHRKGATRAFPAGSPEIPSAYRSVGQPVIIPGSMGTESYILVGQKGSMEATFGTTCHGAGRALSRAAAKREVRADELVRQLAQQGIRVRGASNAGLVEEAPDAYKDVGRVVNVVHKAGLARKVALLRPLGVVKG
jgi:tRNA-splicing ligase RtcB (3'-phosphate/5'-hydroxy nucleic acid ligase)